MLREPVDLDAADPQQVGYLRRPEEVHGRQVRPARGIAETIR